MAGGFTGAVGFLDKLGVYDIVLPFLLVFTLMYAFLEKTKVFGTETYYDVEGKSKMTGSRKNLNGMVSFIVAFFVIASSQLVAVINQTLSHMVILLVLIFCFLLVAGSFHEQSDKGFFLHGAWKTIFLIITFIAIIFIFLNALGWLEPVWNFILKTGTSDAVASVVLIGLIVLFMVWVTGGFKGSGNKGEKSES